MSNQWREEQNRCLSEIERLQAADRSYMDEGAQLLELARNAQRLFAKQELREKRRLLGFMLSNCSWEDGEVVATYRQPFDMLSETAIAAARVETSENAKSAKSEMGCRIRTRVWRQKGHTFSLNKVVCLPVWAFDFKLAHDPSGGGS